MNVTICNQARHKEYKKAHNLFTLAEKIEAQFKGKAVPKKTSRISQGFIFRLFHKFEIRFEAPLEFKAMQNGLDFEAEFNPEEQIKLEQNQLEQAVSPEQEPEDQEDEDN